MTNITIRDWSDTSEDHTFVSEASAMSKTERQESHLNLSFEDVTKIYGILKAVWPTKLTNVKARLWVEALELGFECDDKEIGLFRLTAFDKPGQRVAYLEGANASTTIAEIGFNLRRLDENLLQHAFQMMRNLREFDRTGRLELAREFDAAYHKLIALAPKKAP